LSLAPTVVIIDDDEALRDSLRWLLESVHLRAEFFANPQDFLRTFDPNRPGCLVLDVRMPGMSGLELLDRLSAAKVQVPVIMLTAHADVPMAVRAMKSGAIDFLTKPYSGQELLDRIHHALAIDQRRREELAHQKVLAARFQSLTPREHSVMELVVLGHSNKEIATQLGVSIKTVEAHRNKVMEKTQADSLADLVRLAMACGAVANEPLKPNHDSAHGV
jgi:FixJ family two-component response regulator